MQPSPTHLHLKQLSPIPPHAHTHTHAYTHKIDGEYPKLKYRSTNSHLSIAALFFGIMSRLLPHPHTHTQQQQHRTSKTVGRERGAAVAVVV